MTEDGPTGAVNILFEVETSQRNRQITEPLRRVSASLGAFSRMYFTLVVGTDSTNRDELPAEASREMPRVLAARTPG